MLVGKERHGSRGKDEGVCVRAFELLVNAWLKPHNMGAERIQGEYWRGKGWRITERDREFWE